MCGEPYIAIDLDDIDGDLCSDCRGVDYRGTPIEQATCVDCGRPPSAEDIAFYRSNYATPDRVSVFMCPPCREAAIEELVAVALLAHLVAKAPITTLRSPHRPLSSPTAAPQSSAPWPACWVGWGARTPVQLRHRPGTS